MSVNPLRKCYKRPPIKAFEPIPRAEQRRRHQLHIELQRVMGVTKELDAPSLRQANSGVT